MQNGERAWRFDPSRIFIKGKLTTQHDNKMYTQTRTMGGKRGYAEREGHEWDYVRDDQDVVADLLNNI